MRLKNERPQNSLYFYTMQVRTMSLIIDILLVILLEFSSICVRIVLVMDSQPVVHE